MSTYAMPLLVLATTESASLTGLAFALEWIPRVAAFGLAGDLVDRRGAAIVFFLASSARAVLVAGGSVALTMLKQGTAQTLVVMALAAATGTLTQFSFIANEAVGAIVSRRADTQAHKVQAVLIGIDQTATLTGPALGGVLLLAGPTHMLAVLSVLSCLAAALALQTPPTPLRGSQPGTTQRGAGLKTGWRTLRSLPALGWLVGGLTVSNLALGLLQSASPIIVVERFGLSPAAVGTLWSAAAASTLLTVTVCRFALNRLGLWGVGVVCSTVASAACLALAHAPTYTAYVVLMALFMAGDGGLTVVLRTLRSLLIPAAVFRQHPLPDHPASAAALPARGHRGRPHLAVGPRLRHRGVRRAAGRRPRSRLPASAHRPGPAHSGQTSAGHGLNHCLSQRAPHGGPFVRPGVGSGTGS